MSDMWTDHWSILEDINKLNYFGPTTGHRSKKPNFRLINGNCPPTSTTKEELEFPLGFKEEYESFEYSEKEEFDHEMATLALQQALVPHGYSNEAIEYSIKRKHISNNQGKMNSGSHKAEKVDNKHDFYLKTPDKAKPAIQNISSIVYSPHSINATPQLANTDKTIVTSNEYESLQNKPKVPSSSSSSLNPLVQEFIPSSSTIFNPSVKEFVPGYMRESTNTKIETTQACESKIIPPFCKNKKEILVEPTISNNQKRVNIAMQSIFHMKSQSIQETVVDDYVKSGDKSDTCGEKNTKILSTHSTSSSRGNNNYVSPVRHNTISLDEHDNDEPLPADKKCLSWMMNNEAIRKGTFKSHFVNTAPDLKTLKLDDEDFQFKPKVNSVTSSDKLKSSCHTLSTISCSTVDKKTTNSGNFHDPYASLSFHETYKMLCMKAKKPENKTENVENNNVVLEKAPKTTQVTDMDSLETLSSSTEDEKILTSKHEDTMHQVEKEVEFEHSYTLYSDKADLHVDTESNKFASNSDVKVNKISENVDSTPKAKETPMCIVHPQTPSDMMSVKNSSTTSKEQKTDRLKNLLEDDLYKRLMKINEEKINAMANPISQFESNTIWAAIAPKLKKNKKK